MFMLVFVLGMSLFFAPSLPYVGHLEVKIVKSGSMEPGIKTGSVVVIRENPSYGVGDVITFTSRSADIPTTHRIIDIGADGTFVTKGDANEERDADIVFPNQVIGRVFVDLPYVGFVLDFARQPLGFGLLIGIPAFLIIFDELEKMWVVYRDRKGGRRKDSAPESKESVQCESVSLPVPSVRYEHVSRHDIVPKQRSERTRVMEVPLKETFVFDEYAARASRRGYMSLLVGVIGVGALFGSFGVGDTVSYFRDLERALNNMLGANEIDFTLGADEMSYVVRDGAVVDTDGQIVFSILPVGESRPLRYRVMTEVSGGDTQLCDALYGASVVPFVYNDRLSTLESGTSTSFDGFGGVWNLGISYVDQGTTFAGGTTCMVTITVTGWDAALDESKSQYVDEESITLTFAYDGPEVLPFALPFASESVVEDTSSTSTDTESEGAGTSGEESIPSETSEGDTTEPVEEMLPDEEVVVEEESVLPTEEEEETVPSVPTPGTDEENATEEAEPVPVETPEEESLDTTAEETTTEATQ